MQELNSSAPQYHRLLVTERPRWLVILGALTILAGWLVAGILFMSVQHAVREDPPGTISWLGLLATNLTLICLIPLSLVVARRLNRQTPGLLSSVAGGVRWEYLAWFAMAAIAVEFVLLTVIKVGRLEMPGAAEGAARDAVAVLAVVVFTSSLQAAGEEYFFRGYLLQAAGSFVRNPLFAILFTTLLFAMAHGVWPWDSPALFLDRFAFGLMAAYLAVRTGGLEAPIAAHAANNVVTFVFAALTDNVGGSLGIDDAPWSLVVLDVLKFGLFGLVAVLIVRRQETSAIASTEPVHKI